jgi:hypothetical protein
MTRKRPPNRLAGEVHKIKEEGLTVFLGIYRAPLPDRSGLGPVVNVVMKSRAKIVGTTFHNILDKLTSRLNQELQIQAVKPGEGD